MIMAIVCDICGKKATAKRSFFALATASRIYGDITLHLEPVNDNGLYLAVRSYGCICTDCLKKLNIEKAIADNEELSERLAKRIEKDTPLLPEI